MPPPAEGFASRLFLGPALRTQPDRRLVTLVRDGYETAFEEIVRRYGRPLTRYAASIVGGRCEDVTQDAFSKALMALRRHDVEIELRPWLFRIVRNTALNDLRDSPPSPEVLAEAIAGGRNPAEELEQREELTDLMQRLQALPEPQRAAIVMRELEGLSHEEIAAALGLSGGGARQAIYRARQALRDGIGLLLPLPLVRLSIEHGTEIAAAGAGTGGAVAAAGATAGGAGSAVKVGVVTIVLAGSVGAGVAVQDHRGGERTRGGELPARSSSIPSPNLPPSGALASAGAFEDSGSSGPGGSSSGGSGDNRDTDDSSGEGGDDRGRLGNDEDDDRKGDSGPSSQGPSHGSDQRPEGENSEHDTREGESASPEPEDEHERSGHGGDDSDLAEDENGRAEEDGSGVSGSGSSGSG